MTYNPKRWSERGGWASLEALFWKFQMRWKKSNGCHFIFQSKKNQLWAFSRKRWFFRGKTTQNYHFTFWKKKNAVFVELHKFLSFMKKIILDHSFRIFFWKTAFVVAKNWLSFYFLWKKKYNMQKKVRYSQNIRKKLVWLVSKNSDFHTH